uniref:Genome polyprotein n=1 Tax=Sigmodontinae hepacivirus TaxID=2230895 RepID=A0A499QNG4_9FLAV|nr:polyprotein [Sigmodontinae hepacivirus]
MMFFSYQPVTMAGKRATQRRGPTVVVSWKPPPKTSRRGGPPRLPRGPRMPRGRRRPRDYVYLGSTRGGRIPILDPVLGGLGELLLPRQELPSRDPRRRSRNFGHIIDGALGFAGDLFTHIPIAGPLVGGVGRGVAGAVRLLEDGINFLTRPVGLVLFLLTLAIPAGQSAPTPARRYDDEGRGIALAVTNCCRRDQVVYCTEVMCVHEPGCVICSEGKCWIVASPLTSNHPDHPGSDPVLAGHLDALAFATIVCDLTGANEICAGLVWAAEFVTSYLPMTVPLNDSDCYLVIDTGVEPGVLGFVKWVASEVNWLTLLLGTLAKVPQALVNLFASAHFGVLACLFYYLSSSNYIKAVLVLVVYTESAVAAPLWDNLGTATIKLCSPYLQPPQCGWRTVEPPAEYFCYGPVAGTATGPTKTYNPIPGQWGCVYYWPDNETITCCTTRTVPDFCHSCSSDCSWRDNRLTYEACGTTPFLTTMAIMEKPPSTKYVIKTGALMVPEQWLKFWPGTWKPMVLEIPVLGGGRGEFNIYYDEGFKDNPKWHWARLPFLPQIYRSYWASVPKGFYSDIRDLSSGLLSKDSNEDYQVFYSASGLVNLHGLASRVLVALCLAMLGSKWVLMAYLILMQFTYGEAYAPPALTGTIAVCNTTGLELGFRFLAGYHLGPFAALLMCPNFSTASFFFLCNLAPVEACATCLFHIYSTVLPGLVAALAAGAFAFLAPRLSYTLGYLSGWFLHFGELIWTDNKHLTILALVVWPHMLFELALVYISIVTLLWTFSNLVFSLLPVHTTPQMVTLLRTLALWKSSISRWMVSVALCLGADRDHWVFKHLTPVAEINWLPNVDPYFPLRTSVVVERAAGERASCGEVRRTKLGRLPVIGARPGEVVCGVGPLPSGFLRAGPVALRRVSEKGFLKHLRTVVVGVDTGEAGGSIFTFGSATKRWMGFAFAGRTVTANHGARGMRIATIEGPRAALMVSKEHDMAVYPRIHASTDLEPCNCNTKVGYLTLRDGSIREVCHEKEEKWLCVSHLPLTLARGSSGAPLLCAQGHVIGMFVSVFKTMASVSAIRVKPLGPAASVEAAQSVTATLDAPPPVPREQKIITMVAPTGSGKSTVLPMHYVREGYNVLVLNPSVATTLAMDDYVSRQFKFPPNIMAADTTINRGSRLTYSTYGRFLAGRGLRGYDVVICDECHATDGTSLLGIGACLSLLPETSVKLCILATATPPGCPVTSHPNIDEIEMPKEGEVELVAGRFLQLALVKKGRHLVFLPSKKRCEEVAATLTAAGIRAVAYYRGLPISSIPVSGDCVVVATDALMTGYTGNFDTVWDSCQSVQPILNVDLDPTFSILMRTGPSSALTRIQRRGRTGRGRRGQYFWAAPPPGGCDVAPAVSTIEAFDSGLAYFGLTPAEVSMYLSTYHHTPGVNSINMPLSSWCDFFHSISQVEPAFVNAAKMHAESFEWLTAYARQLYHREGRKAPSDDERWKGVRGVNEPVVLYHLDGRINVTKEATCCETLRSCFAEEYTSLTAVVTAAAGMGAGVVLLTAAAETFGFFSPISRFALHDVDDTARLVDEIECPDLEVEECAISCVSECIPVVQQHLAAWRDWVVAQVAPKVAPEGLERIHAALTTPTAVSVFGLLQYLAGLLTLPSNPVVGSAMGFCGTFLAPISHQVKLFFSLLGGAFASRLTTMRGSTMFVCSTMLGSIASAWTTPAFLIECISGYTASTHAAAVTMTILCGQVPSIDLLVGLTSGLLSPMACLSGAALGVACWVLSRDSNNIWTNRLLSMLAKQTTCQGYFEEAKNLRETLLNLLVSFTPWQIIQKVLNWLASPGEEDCAEGWARGLWVALGNLARAVLEFIRGLLTCVIKIPGMPYASCDRGWKGLWTGDGVINVTCACGRDSVWTVVDGLARRAGGSRLCCAAWTGRVPINATLRGGPRPLPVNPRRYTTPQGYYQYAEYERRGDEVWLIATSSPKTIVPLGEPNARSAVKVDGMVVCPWAGPCDTSWTGKVLYKGKERNLPICVTNLALSHPDAESAAEVHSAQAAARVVEALKQDLSPAKLTQETNALSNWEMPRKVLEFQIKREASLRQGKYRTSEDDIWDNWDPLAFEEPEAAKIEVEDLTPSTEKGGATPEKTPSRKSSPPPVEVPWSLEVKADIHPTPKFGSLPDAVKAVEALSLKAERLPVDTIADKLARIQLTRSASTRSLPLLPLDRAGGLGLREESSLQTETSFHTPPASATGESSGWETTSSVEEPCSYSYVWAGFTPATYTPRIPTAVAIATKGLARVRTKAYMTRPEEIVGRISKVTKWREFHSDQNLDAWYEKARLRARNVRARELTFEEAALLTKPKAAKSHLSGLTASDLKRLTEKAKRLCTMVYDQVSTGKLEEDYRTVTIMPKVEVFALTPEKPTRKPPRIIAYPPLETRTVEKMVLGEVGPKVVKAVCGKAYGFSYTPLQRVDRMVEMWRAFREPMGFTCDTVCFDSTITPQDVARECKLYQAAQTSQATKERIKVLHEQLYAAGPMRTQDGQFAGQRYCRASGVFTTSSSNTMTCWVKVNAALSAAGFSTWDLLVNGDDCVIVTQSAGYEEDLNRCSRFSSVMKKYGCPQDATATPKYSLEELDSCSSNVSVALTSDRKPIYHLTRDPRIPFARCMMEADRANPTGAWIGFLIQHATSLWASRIITTHLLQYLLFTDPLPKTLTFDWWGKDWSVPLGRLPEILEALHGEDVRRARIYTPYEVARVSKALSDMSWRPLRAWRKLARETRVACMKRGGVLKKLALYLLWWDHHIPIPKLDRAIVDKYKEFNYNDFYAEPLDVDRIEAPSRGVYLGIVSLALISLFLILI